MKTYKVDLDYENYLFDENYNEESDAYKKIAQSFEYIFFLINKNPCKIKNQKNYSRDYLKKIKDLGFYIPEFSPTEEDFTYWWGTRTDKEKEKRYNSKITSAKIALEHNWGMFDGALVTKSLEVKNHLEKHSQYKKWLIKKPHSYSGIGHYFFDLENYSTETIDKIINGNTVLLEPVRNRILDIGTTFQIENGVILNQFMVENFNSSTGRFKGAMAAQDLSSFREIILKKYNYDLNELISITKEIAALYLEMGCTSNVQIDSFIYEEGGELKLYPLVEVNYRKTMGLVVQSLTNHFSEAKYLEWKIMNHKEVEEIKSRDLEFLTKWTEISPSDLHFKSFYRAY